MLTEYVNAVERGRFQFPKIQTAYLAHKYAQVGDLYQTGQQFHLPDEVCALALGWRAARQFGGVIDITPGFTPREEEPTADELLFANPRKEQGAVDTPVPHDGAVYAVDEPDLVSFLA
jgi:hypothetical protein